jgi:hypothetical protein
MTPSYREGWSTPMRVFFWAVAVINALLSLLFFVLTVYEFGLTKRVNFHTVFHGVLCCVVAVGSVKIQQHPEKVADYEDRIRAFFQR